MADTDPNETPEQPEDAAPEAEGESSDPQDAGGEAADATDGDAAPDADASSEAAEDEPKEQTEAERLAAAALAAAQAAVTGINSGEEEPAPAEQSPAESAQVDFAALASEAAGETSDTDAASAEADAAMAAMMQGASAVNMPAFDAGKLADAPEGIDMLSDVNLDVTIELGRTRMYVEDVLKLSEGAVVELDKLAGDPVDIYVNQRHVARGEVLILNDNFCVRVNEIVDSHPEAAAG